MTPQERAEGEAFAAFVIVRRHLQQPQLLTDDIAVQELTQLVATSGSLDWLSAEVGQQRREPTSRTSRIGFPLTRFRFQTKSHRLPRRNRLTEFLPCVPDQFWLHE
jgi:hypothetical protein